MLQETIIKSAIAEILTIIRSVIHLIVKFPEISDSAIYILKQISKT